MYLKTNALFFTTSSSMFKQLYILYELINRTRKEKAKCPRANFPTKLFVYKQAKKVYSKPINNFLSTLTKRRMYTKYFVANICLNEKTFDVLYQVKSFLITYVINKQAERVKINHRMRKKQKKLDNSSPFKYVLDLTVMDSLKISDCQMIQQHK